MPFATVKSNLENRGYAVAVCATKEEAAAHIASRLHGETVGFGGSITLQDMGLYELLQKDNTPLWHWKDADGAEAKNRFGEFTAYVASANALAETGEIVNIDGTGNRLAGTLYGPKKLFFVIGKNKLAKDLPSAIHRARNVASPINAKRLGRKTPCVADGKCHDCRSPERICGALAVHMRPMTGMRTEVVLVEEELGF